MINKYDVFYSLIRENAEFHYRHFSLPAGSRNRVSGAGRGGGVSNGSANDVAELFKSHSRGISKQN